MPSTDDQAANRRHLEALLERHAELRKRISRALLIALHTRGIVSVDAIHQEARARARRAAPQAPETLDENVPLARRWDADEQASLAERRGSRRHGSPASKGEERRRQARPRLASPATTPRGCCGTGYRGERTGVAQD